MVEELHKDFKLVVVGDGMIGKTSLLITYTTNQFPSIYVPTVFETYYQTISLNNDQTINFSLYDTAGQEGYERLRLLSYQETDVVILCFSIINPASFNNIRDVWYPEINHWIPKAKIFLVGTKKDLKEDPMICQQLRRNYTRPITKEQGENLKDEISAYKYIECSAKTTENVRLIFEEAVKCVLDSRLNEMNELKKKRYCCFVL